MNGRALIVGKFYPPHDGHFKLIDTALSEQEIVYLGVCWSSKESIPVEDRIAWLKDKYHKRVKIFPIHDESPVLYTDETWDLFLEALIVGLTPVMLNHGLSDLYRLPTIIYSGEDYVPEFARRLREAGESYFGFYWPEIEYRKLDRSEMPGVSASAIRRDPRNNWNRLSPAARAGMCKRVVICGAESSGTTTLAKDLANIYATPVVPEYGRHFDWAVGQSYRWTSADFTHIAARQKQWEEDFARRSEGGLLICDTDEFATAMFHEVYLDGEKSPVVFDQALRTPADLYIITSDEGIEFEDDGVRYNSGCRSWQTEWFKSQLPSPQITVTGPPDARVIQAVKKIEAILDWDLAAPIEYSPGYVYNDLEQT